MKLNIALTCAVLALAPTVGMAEGCNYGKDKQAMTCAEGSVYDFATGTCVTTTT